MEKKRSVGVTILGYLNFVFFGILGLLLWTSGLLMSFFGVLNNTILREFGSLFLGRIFLIYGILISFGLMITGNRILNLDEKARIKTVHIALIMLLCNILFNLRYIFSLQFIGGLIYPILLIYFFTRPKVKEQFK